MLYSNNIKLGRSLGTRLINAMWGVVCLRQSISSSKPQISNPSLIAILTALILHRCTRSWVTNPALWSFWGGDFHTHRKEVNDNLFSIDRYISTNEIQGANSGSRTTLGMEISTIKVGSLIIHVP